MNGCSSEVCRAACDNCYKYICNWGWISSVHLSYSSPMDTLVLLYFAESSFLCRFRVESVNVFVLPRFNFCTSDIFLINKQFRTCANAFPNEFTVRSYEYWAGQHWILSWMEENKTATYFLHSRLFYIWYYEKFQLQYIFMVF